MVASPDLFADDASLSNAEYRTESVYEAIYGEDDLRALVCSARVEVAGTQTDNRGNQTTETLLITSMDQAIANSVNRRNVGAVSFPSVWTVEYISPEAEAQATRESIEQAADCMDDGGLFDFDWAECP